MAQTIYVLNGPNMNLLGTREPEKYGRATLADVEKLCRATAKRFGFDIVFRQSNREGELVDWIQEAHAKKAAGLVINPAGYTTTSIAILDALLAVQMSRPSRSTSPISTSAKPSGITPMSRRRRRRSSAASASTATRWRSPGSPAWSAPRKNTDGIRDGQKRRKHRWSITRSSMS